MKSFILLNILFGTLAIIKSDLPESQKIIPLNFRDGIVHLNSRLQSHKLFEKAQDNLFQLKALNFSFNSLIEDSIEKFLRTENAMNISKECTLQLNQFFHGFKNKMEWSFKVIDSFGKMPSGVMNGNLAWLGEFSECRNISAINGNWKGKYVLLSKPLESNDPQSEIQNGAVKYGICVPNKCNQDDIYEIINLVLEVIPQDIKSALPFELKINETYIGIRDVKVLSYAARVTLYFLGSIVAIVLLSTLFDCIKRFKHYLKCRKIISNSTIIVNSETDELINSTTTEIHNQNMDLEQSYLHSISHDSVFSQILVSLSAYTNTLKMFKVNGNSDEFKCLHAIRVLSLAWVILGHSYIFSLIFVDNLAMIQPILQRFSFMIVSNAFFSVDTFFFLSGFLTCYTFIKEVENNNGKLSFWFMIKYYIHRYWRLTPAYVIAYFISLTLSGYFGDGPLYSEQGLESEECYKQWWGNFLYVNNFYKSENFCFGISWYLANDFQFHIFAPLILIPFALKKVLLGLAISMFLLVINVVSIVLNLYFRHIEAAQYGQNFKEFFSDFYIIPWYRMAPYIIGILFGYAVLINKKKINKIHHLKNLGMWIFSILLTSLVIFGLYPDALGENPLSRETRIIYQSFSKIAWSFAIGYIVYSCIMSTGGIVNKILCWPIWTPLSRINYSAYLIHIIIIMSFNSNQEHLIHLQDLNMVINFLAELIFSYTFAYFFNIFFEQPWVAIEKFIIKR